MSSFLLQKKQNQTFNEKIANRSKRTREIFETVQKSFNQFCMQQYENRTSTEIFTELHTLQNQEQICRFCSGICDYFSFNGNYLKDYWN